MTSPVHDCGRQWLSRWTYELEFQGHVKRFGIHQISNVKYKNFLGTYTGR